MRTIQGVLATMLAVSGAAVGLVAGTAAEAPSMPDVPFYKATAARSGLHPGPGPVAEPIEAWRTSLGCAVGERTAVIGAGLVLIGCDDPHFFAIDGQTGAILWTAELPGPARGSGAVADGVVVVPDLAGHLTALDLSSGAERWSIELPAAGSPVVVDGLLYTGTDDGRYLGIDLAHGSIAWTYDAPEAVQGTGGTVLEGTAYVGGDDGVMRAVDLVDGSERWAFQAASGALSSPAIGDGLLYVGLRTDELNPDGQLYALDLESGEERWRAHAPGGGQIGPGAAFDGMVVSGSGDGGLFAFAADDGHAVWTQDAPVTYFPLAISPPAVYGIFDRSVGAYALADGAPLWQMDLGATTRSSPVVSGGATIVGDEAGVIHAFVEPDAVASPGATTVVNVASQAPAASGAPSPLSLRRIISPEEGGYTATGGMAIDAEGDLVFADVKASRIVVLDQSGTPVRSWGSPGQGAGELDFVRDPSDPFSAFGDVAIGPDGSVYVADAGNHRVQRFDADGGFMGQWGRFGRNEGQFLDPIGVDVGPDGDVFVVDDQRDDIQRFSSDGRYLTAIGGHGTAPGKLGYTGLVHVGPDGTIHNADWGNRRIQAWDDAGRSLWTIVDDAQGDPGFESPNDLVVDAHGWIHVADMGAIHTFDADHRFLGSWEPPDGGMAEFVEVAGDTLYVTGGPFDGRIYVLDIVGR